MMRFLFLFLILAGNLCAQAVPPASAPIMPVKEIRPGMHGVAYTVLQGTEVVPLQVEIMGVAENALGPGLDLIIGKLVDPKTALTEAVHGMSGSPLYIDGKLAGALSRRLTEFEKDGQCGFTPIEPMLEVGAMAEAPGSVPVVSRLLSPFHFTKGDGMVEPPGPSYQTLGVPLSVTGLSAAALSHLWHALGVEGPGFIPVSSGGSGSIARLSHADLKPGAAVSAVMMTGDLNVDGTGTVTTRVGDRILAFGHAMENIGASSWGLAPAEIITTIPSYSMPFKMSNAGPIVGTVTQDRLCAIAGTIGPMPSMAAYRIDAVHDGQAAAPLRGRFVTEKTMVPVLVATAVASALQETNRSGHPLFLHVSGALHFKGDLPPLQMDAVASGEEIEAEQALLTLVEPISILYRQNWEMPVATSLDLHIETAEEVRSWQIEEARVDDRRIDPGGTVGVDVILQKRYGSREVRHFDLPLPPALKEGSFRVRVSGAQALDVERIMGAAPGIETAAQFIALFNARRRADRLYVQIVTDAPGRIVAERELPGLPSSVLSVMGSGAVGAGAKTVPMGEQVWYETSAEMPGVVGGQQNVTLDIHS